MAAEYQQMDWPVADYAPFCLDDRILDPSTSRPLFIRGPRPASLEPSGYFACLGAAQTFGRFCEQPFPTLLAERLGLPVLNISHGGAGPAFFSAGDGPLLDYLNGARFVIVQVMSGRSNGNSRFESDGVGYYRRRSDGAEMGCDEAFAQLIRTESRETLARLVEETRENWCDTYRALLARITAPKILLWFATRKPAYRQGWRTVTDLFGAFPQLVNQRMFDAVRAQCEHSVSCISKRGLPQTLRDRFSGARVTIVDPWTSQPWKQNWYYPSPEMHVDAADMLEPVCRATIHPGAPAPDARGRGWLGRWL